MRYEIDTRWHADAACRGAQRLMFVEGQRLAELIDQIRAEYCAGCPVRRSCLHHALSFPERHGAWAGTTPELREGFAAADTDELLHLLEQEEAEWRQDVDDNAA